MNSMYVLLAAIAVASIGFSFVALKKYTNEKYHKEHTHYALRVGLLSTISFIIVVYFLNVYIENKREHFYKGGLMRCAGKLDNYLVSNKDYILRDDYFIKEGRVLSLDFCERIE